MGMKGDLCSVKLVDVFQMLGASPEQQVLTVRIEDSARHFIFGNNQISLALNQKKLGPIGQLLVHLGTITEDQLNQALM